MPIVEATIPIHEPRAVLADLEGIDVVDPDSFEAQLYRAVSNESTKVEAVPIYNLGAEWATGNTIVADGPVAWLYIFFEPDAVLGAAELVEREKEPELLSVSKGSHVLKTMQALRRAREEVGRSRAELRLLRIPAIHARVIWLKSSDNSQDKVIPIEPVQAPLDASARVYSASELLDAVRSVEGPRRSSVPVEPRDARRSSKA